MKRKLLTVSLLLLCLALIAGATYAYYTTTVTARNTITMGSVTIAIEEFEEVDEVLVPLKETALAMVPDAPVSRVVTVKCVKEPAYVRMKYEVQVLNAKGEIVKTDPDRVKRMVLVDTDTESWTEKDGWWYYNTPLEAGKSTQPLFEEVTFSGQHITNDYQNCTVELTVTAEAVQAANNGDGKDVFTAKGWPEGGKEE